MEGVSRLAEPVSVAGAVPTILAERPASLKDSDNPDKAMTFPGESS